MTAQPRRLRWGVAIVRGRSMQPTLADGDRLLARWRPAGARPGRLVIVRLPGGRGVSVKRIVHRDPDGWWVQRDNPAEGIDSWLVGAIQDADLLGIVLLRLWPRPRRF